MYTPANLCATIIVLLNEWKDVKLLQSSFKNSIKIDMHGVIHTNNLIVIALRKCQPETVQFALFQRTIMPCTQRNIRLKRK